MTVTVHRLGRSESSWSIKSQKQSKLTTWNQHLHHRRRHRLEQQSTLLKACCQCQSCLVMWLPKLYAIDTFFIRLNFELSKKKLCQGQLKKEWTILLYLISPFRHDDDQLKFKNERKFYSFSIISTHVCSSAFCDIIFMVLEKKIVRNFTT